MSDASLPIALQALGLGAGANSLLQTPGSIFTSPRIAKFHRDVSEQVLDLDILICGDSTGATDLTTPRWPQRLAALIAAQYPTHTVTFRPWDDATKTYPSGSSIAVQTGTGSRTIRVWNASVSGSVIGYILSNVSTITSGVVPSIIIMNYGHNSPQDYTNYRGITQQGVDILSSIFPDAAVLITIQNPRAPYTTGNTTEAEYAPDQIRQRANFDFALACGYPVVNVNDAFRAVQDYATTLLIDGLHCSAAGYQLWANIAWSVMRPGLYVAPSGHQESNLDRVWVPATAFEAASGSPSYAVALGMPAWALDQSSEEAICTTVDFPSDWKCSNIEVLYSCASTPSGGANAVALLASYQYLSDASGTTVSLTVGNYSDNPLGAVAGTISTAGANRIGNCNAWNRSQLSGRPIALKITRKAADAADTLPQDALVFGVIIRRMY